MYSESRSVQVSFIVTPPSIPQSAIRNPQSFKMFPQRHPRMMQLRFRRPGHDPEHVRDLLVLVALYVVQHEHLTRAVGQSPDRLLEIERQVVDHGAARQCVERILGIGIGSAVSASPVPPPPVAWSGSLRSVTAPGLVSSMC